MINHEPRVANDLIPYLLGKENRYPFFPPILAILVPTPEKEQHGIENAYPVPEPFEVAEGVEGYQYGDVFKTAPFVCDGEVSPITKVGFNPHRTAFVIADGQHRAMAVLALFRQYRRKWDEGQQYRSFYDHIDPKPEQIVSLELPVCVLYFPQLYEGSDKLEKLDNGLITICRQVFLDVNKEAREVSHARQLLLDDTDFGAALMRQVLSDVQEQEQIPGNAELLSFEYNDDEAVERPNQRSPLKVTSSAAIYAMTRALSFGSSGAFEIDSGADLTDGRRCRATKRAAKLIGRFPGQDGKIKINRVKEYGPQESNEINERLARLWRPVLPGMYNSIHPFRGHNQAISQFKEIARARKVKSNADDTVCRAVDLLLSLGPERMHFRRHKERVESEGANAPLRDEAELKQAKKDFEATESLMSKLEHHFEGIRLRFFWGEEMADELSQSKREAGENVFQIVTTQAFQMGVAMTVAGLLEYIRSKEDHMLDFDTRIECVKFLSDLVFEALNHYFAVDDVETVSGADAPKFVRAFGDGRQGFLDLLRTPKDRTMGANNYKFFRYMITEVMFSESGLGVQDRMLDDETYSDRARKLYLGAVRTTEDEPTGVVEALHDARVKYLNRFADAAVKTQEFKTKLQERKIKLRERGTPESDIIDELESMKETRRNEASSTAREFIRNSVDLIPQHLQEEVNEKLAVV